MDRGVHDVMSHSKGLLLNYLRPVIFKTSNMIMAPISNHHTKSLAIIAIKLLTIGFSNRLLECRNWTALNHHTTLTMIALCFLQHVRLGGKKVQRSPAVGTAAKTN